MKETAMQASSIQKTARSTEDRTPQFTIEAERALEYVELLESLGNEVRVEALDPARLPDEACSACLMAACDRYVVIYTRRRRTEAQA